MNFDIASALQSLKPGTRWVVRGTNYSDIEWLDESEMPSEEEIVTEMSRLQYAYDVMQYQRLRAKEYPSFADQFDILYHEGYDAWKLVITAVKEKYPKLDDN